MHHRVWGERNKWTHSLTLESLTAPCWLRHLLTLFLLINQQSSNTHTDLLIIFCCSLMCFCGVCVHVCVNVWMCVCARLCVSVCLSGSNSSVASQMVWWEIDTEKRSCNLGLELDPVTQWNTLTHLHTLIHTFIHTLTYLLTTNKTPKLMPTPLFHCIIALHTHVHIQAPFNHTSIDHCHKYTQSLSLTLS